ncbi:hypothetical protein TSMEX_009506 [Taenia solium]|eukprot:TsM_001010600 transcript=TsM_001010600 gene=TsM_001010600
MLRVRSLAGTAAAATDWQVTHTHRRVRRRICARVRLVWTEAISFTIQSRPIPRKSKFCPTVIPEIDDRVEVTVQNFQFFYLPKAKVGSGPPARRERRSRSPLTSTTRPSTNAASRGGGGDGKPSGSGVADSAPKESTGKQPQRASSRGKQVATAGGGGASRKRSPSSSSSSSSSTSSSSSSSAGSSSRSSTSSSSGFLSLSYSRFYSYLSLALHPLILVSLALSPPDIVVAFGKVITAIIVTARHPRRISGLVVLGAAVKKPDLMHGKFYPRRTRFDLNIIALESSPVLTNCSAHLHGEVCLASPKISFIAIRFLLEGITKWEFYFKVICPHISQERH